MSLPRDTCRQILYECKELITKHPVFTAEHFRGDETPLNGLSGGGRGFPEDGGDLGDGQQDRQIIQGPLRFRGRSAPTLPCLRFVHLGPLPLCVSVYIYRYI